MAWSTAKAGEVDANIAEPTRDKLVRLLMVIRSNMGILAEVAAIDVHRKPGVTLEPKRLIQNQRQWLNSFI